VKFAANNHINVFIEVISFFVDHDYHLRSEIESSKHYEENRKAEIRKTDKILKKQKQMIQ
jgi:hypothetical protein